MLETRIVTQSRNLRGATMNNVKPTAGRLAVNLPLDMLEMLKRWAKQDGTTVTQVVRQAVATEQFISGQLEAGNEILVRPKGKSVASPVFILR